MRSSFVIRGPIALSAALLAAACGDLYSDPTAPGDPTELPLPPQSVVDASATVPHDLITNCSTTPRVEGTDCVGTQPGTVCEYGASPDMRCNTTLACTSNQPSFAPSWVARPSILCPTYACPQGDAATIDGTPCALPSNDGGAPADADELVCPMDDAVCACTTGPDAAHAHERRWVCAKPANGCPTTRPLAGQRCSSPRACDYGSCSFKRGLRMECTSGVWLTGGGTCN